MGNLVFQANLGGQVNVVGPNTASTYNINVPTVNGTLVTTGDTGTVTNTMLAGSIANNKLTNSSVTYGTTTVSLGGTSTTLDGINIGSTTPGTGAFTTLSVSGNVTYSGGTANGVLYLNGSKVATSGSALVFDGTNLGLGVTPSAWTTSWKALQIAATSSLSDYSGQSTYWNNCIVIGATTPTYQTTAAASFYRQSGGVHYWYNAPSGTAGNAISFTQAMTLDASGNLVLGGTSSLSSAANRVDLTINGASTAMLTFGVGAVRKGFVIQDATDMTISNEVAGALVLKTNATERARITSGGEFYVAGTTDQGAYNIQCNGTGVWGAGAYVNGSDARIKEEIAPIDSGLDVVQKLNPVTYKYKEDWTKDRSTQTGFIAQELQVALEGKNYVDGIVQQGGSEGYYSVAYQNIIPILTKAIQELKAELDQAKAEIATLKGA